MNMYSLRLQVVRMNEAACYFVDAGNNRYFLTWLSNHFGMSSSNLLT